MFLERRANRSDESVGISRVYRAGSAAGQRIAVRFGSGTRSMGAKRAKTSE